MNSMKRGLRISPPTRTAARRSRGEGGAATTILLVSMCLLLVAGTLALGRIGHANDLRTKAQTGADAAALGALEPLRRRAIDLALQGIPSDGIGQWMIGGSPDDPAGGYARRNGTALAGKVRLSGSLGHTAKVSVRTRDCQLKREDELTPQEQADLRMGRNLCTDTSGKRGIGRHGTATAIAAFDPPACVRKFPGGAAVPGEGNPEEGSGHMECDGVKIRPNGGGRAQVAKLFKLRLVDKEDPVPFTGAPSFSDVAGFTGPLPPLPANASALVKKIIAFAYAQIGKPYIWGGTGPAGRGHDPAHHVRPVPVRRAGRRGRRAARGPGVLQLGPGQRAGPPRARGAGGGPRAQAGGGGELHRVRPDQGQVVRGTQRRRLHPPAGPLRQDMIPPDRAPNM